MLVFLFFVGLLCNSILAAPTMNLHLVCHSHDDVSLQRSVLWWILFLFSRAGEKPLISITLERINLLLAVFLSLSCFTPAAPSFTTLCRSSAGVRYILDAVVTELLKNPERKFTYGEQVQAIGPNLSRGCYGRGKSRYNLLARDDQTCLTKHVNEGTRSYEPRREYQWEKSEN